MKSKLKKVGHTCEIGLGEILQILFLLGLAWITAGAWRFRVLAE